MEKCIEVMELRKHLSIHVYKVRICMLRNLVFTWIFVYMIEDT
jgi:hypothetical protein